MKSLVWSQEAFMKVRANIRVDELSSDALESEKLRRFQQIWMELKGARDLPFRADVSPERLGFLLGHVTIVDVLRKPLNFRYKLIGTKIEEAGRLGDQGKTVDQIEPIAYRKMVEAAFRQVVDGREPLCQRIIYQYHQRQVSLERVIVPFTVAGSDVEVLFEASDWPPGIHQDLRNLDYSDGKKPATTTYRPQ